MTKKILFLFFLFLPLFQACSAPATVVKIKNPPTDFFVKIFKKLEITRCHKEKPKKGPICETRTYTSVGSGLMIKLTSGKKIILSAGHVCDTSDELVEENKKHKYSWIQTISILDRNKRVHDGHVVLSSQAGNKSSDLCAIWAPSLEYLSKFSNISISKRPPIVGEEVYYIGAPVGIYHPPTALIVKGIFSGDIDQFTSLTSIPGAPGASGSVVLSLENKIYGVLFAIHPNFPTASIITNFDETRLFLNKVEKMLPQD